MSDLLRFPASETEALYKEKGSKFIAYVFVVHSTEEVKEKIKYLRELHPQAVHVCSAWHLYADNHEGQSSDDGEPSGSAGKPILNRIFSHRVRDVLVAVVRYYGGVKLGVSGLIHAYKTVSDEALNMAGVEESEQKTSRTFLFDYKMEGEMQSLLKKHRGEILYKDYGQHICWKVSFPISEQFDLPYGVSEKENEPT